MAVAQETKRYQIGTLVSGNMDQNPAYPPLFNFEPQPNRVTPKWLALVNGLPRTQTCGPISGGLILTHTHIMAQSSKQFSRRPRSEDT